MESLCDRIERYLKELLDGGSGLIEIRRNTLAERFGCVPSQINYVLETRFTIERGYLVQSRRGGGGYVRIQRRPAESGARLIEIISKGVGDRLPRVVAEGYVSRLEEEGLITRREAEVMREVLGRGVTCMDVEMRDYVRAELFRSMLLALARTM